MAKDHVSTYQRRNQRAQQEGYASYNVKRRYLSEYARGPGKEVTGPTEVAPSGAIQAYVDNMTRYGRKRTNKTYRDKIRHNEWTEDYLDEYPDSDFDWEEWRDTYSTT